MWYKKFFLLPIFILGIGSWVWADSGHDGGKGHPDKAWERVRMVRMLKMTEALNMDKEQAARFFALDNQFEENKRKSWRELHEDTQKLRSLVREANPPERELRDIVNRIKTRKRNLNDLNNKQIDEELNLLRPEQQARYILFTIDFRRELENLIREVREGK
jgi:hypothetical protein